MRKAMTMGAVALALLMTGGCEAPRPNYPDLAKPVNDTNDLLRRGRALSAAHAVITTQLALQHLLAAVNQAASAELRGEQPFLALGTPDPAARATYTIDTAAGTGRIDVMRDGRSTMGVSFRYAHEAVAEGFRIDVTEASGMVEGFAFAEDGMSVLFRDASAGWRADVELRARLTHPAGDVRTAIARLALPGGKAASGVMLGSLSILVPAEDARFEGTIMAAAGSPVTRGGLDVAGKREFDVRLAGEGTVEITPAAP